MSYLAVDLDALNVMPDVASAAGITSGAVAHGLLKLWAWCFREEVEVVSRVHLKGFFGVDAGPALEAFGFLESAGEAWRVRGAQRYLRVKQAQREGGKKGRAKSSSHIGRTRPHTSTPTSGSTLAPTSASTAGSAQALTPSTEHRAPNTFKALRVAEATPLAPSGDLFESVPPQPTNPPPPLKSKPPKPPKAPKAEKPPDPRHRPLLEAMVEIFREVRGAPPTLVNGAGGAWAKGVADLLAISEPYEVVRRWRLGLPGKFPSVNSPIDLAKHWDHWTGERADPQRVDPNGGILRHAASSAAEPFDAEKEFGA